MKKIVTLLVTVFLFNCTPANIYITGEKRAPIPIENVIVYNEQTVPKGYEIVGEMSVRSTGYGSAHKRNLEKLKKKAANVGANGILLGPSQYSSTSEENYIGINATAIYVEK